MAPGPRPGLGVDGGESPLVPGGRGGRRPPSRRPRRAPRHPERRGLLTVSTQAIP